MAGYAIGVDGGGTKTEAVVMDWEGRVRARARGPSCNPYHVGWDTATHRVAAVVDEVLQKAHLTITDVITATLALAGVHRDPEREAWRRWARRQWPTIALRVENDALAALVGGAGSPYGIVIVAGTGMIAYGVNAAGHHARAGGWGYRLDRGSGYALGEAAVRAVLAGAEGMDLCTRLQQVVLNALGLDTPEALIPWFHHPNTTVDTIAALAPHVVRAAEAGDPVAAGIVAEGADALAQAATQVAEKIGLTAEQFPLVLSGGLLTHLPFYREVVLQALHLHLPTAQPTLPQADAAVGAAWLAWDHVGHTLAKRPVAQPDDSPCSTWSTEEPNVLSRDLDTRSAFEIVGIMHVEDYRAVSAVRRTLPAIAAAVEAITSRLARGGRLIYVGAGTSGRLGVLDASECPPTFNTPPDMVVGLMAGGGDAFQHANEAAEDDEAAGYQAAMGLDLNAQDVMVGVSASGRTPYVIGAMKAARHQGAFTIALVCNRDTPLSRLADHTIAPLVGPEVIAGSTRLKAGTAQKLILNMLSTATMVRLGKVYDNLMVDVRPENRKLQKRARYIIMRACRVDEETAATALRRSGGNVKVALVSLLTGCSPEEARQRLNMCHGRVRDAVRAQGGGTAA